MSFAHHSRFRRPQRERAMIVAAAVILLLSSTAGAIFFILPSGEPAQAMTEKTETAPQLMRAVILPTREIEADEALRPELFREEFRPAAYVSSHAVRSIEEVKGRYAGVRLVPDEPVLAMYVAQTKSASPLSPKLSGDSRAVTIHVTEVGSVDGMVRPGDIVDVAWFYTLNKEPAIRVIVQNARVLGADRQVDSTWRPGLPAPGTITLLLTPEDTRRVQLAAQTGTLSLSLRGPDAKFNPGAEDPLTFKGISGVGGPRDDRTEATECRGRVSFGQSVWCMREDGSLRPI